MPSSNRKKNKVAGVDRSKVPFDSTPPKAVISRLSLYLRELQRLLAEGQITVSSSTLGKRLGSSDTQVRKDFACFGQFGYPGKGYDCLELVHRIKKILGTDRVWPVALIGCGNLGQALMGYGGFLKQGFELIAAFDTSRTIIGKRVGNVVVLDFAKFPRVVRQKKIHLGILAVTASAAQEIAQAMAEAGITGILNFAPVALDLPNSVAVSSVDLAVELEQLSFAVVSALEN
jgi:redox-sensing transcriptional repressor